MRILSVPKIHGLGERQAQVLRKTRRLMKFKTPIAAHPF